VVQEVVCGIEGILQGERPGQLVVDCGTTDYLWTIDFAKKLAAQGIDFVDAPVTGMELRAKNATLTIMFGGPQRLLEKIRPALDAMGNRIVHMGDVGSGQLAKLVNQLLFNTHMAALAEVLPMAVNLGLDAEKIAQVINTGSGHSFASETFIPHILENRFAHGYSMKNAYKDMAGALNISATHQIPLPVVQAATATYQRALRSGYGDQDKGAMIKLFEGLLNVMFRKPQFK
jgi:3-hydroxyisobutyrate dehydrogenase-like beta-hydroxyacid dehydrogenase